MKRLSYILLLFLLCVASTEAGSIITATITVTNTPSDGDTITVNGSARTWKDTVATPASQVVIGASIGENATNLFNHFAATPFTTLTLIRSGTNAVKLRGIIDQALTATVAGTWGETTYVTNTTTEGSQVMTPFSSYSTQTKATNIAAQLVTDIETYSTNSFGVGTTVLTNYADLTTSQTLSNKLIFGGSTTNIDAGITTAWIGTANIYGGVNVSNTSPIILINDTDAAADEGITKITAYSGDFTITTLNDAGTVEDAIIQVSRTAEFVTGIYLGGDISTDNDFTAGGNITAALLTNTPVQGSTLTLNTYSGNIGSLTNGAIVGSTLTGVTISGTVGLLSSGYMNAVGSTNMSATNSTMKGVTAFPGGVNLERSNHTSLANGVNGSINFGDAVYIKIKAGPTAAFSIAGIANGANGKFYRLHNTTGQDMTILRQSGLDATAANRLETDTGADIATTGDGIADVWYDSEDSVWRAAIISQ